MEKNCKKCYLRNDQEVDFDELRLLSQYVPYKVVKLIGQAECCIFEQKTTEFKGTVVYFDIINFTPIIVNYLNTKRDIADLSDTFSEFYSVITETVRGFGGSIYQFAGDSILISFEKIKNETTVENFKRAFTAMLRTLELSDNYNSVSKDANGFSLKPKIGIATGSYSQILLGHKDLFVTPALLGQAVKNAISCEKQCKQQGIIIDSKTFEYAKKCGLESSFVEEEKFYRFNQVEESFFDNIIYPDYFDTEELFEKPFFYNRLLAFLNPVIRQHIENSFQGFAGEYKDITCVMVRFDGSFVKKLSSKVTEEFLSPLDSIFININNTACKYGGYCMKPDLSDKGIVFPVVFGTPYALEHKERNAILFSSEIIKTSKASEAITSVNIGVVTGTVYSGEFGGVIRKDYTTIGNSVNFASRLMVFGIEKSKFSILMDEDTKTSLENFCKTKTVSGITCKGYDGEQTAYEFTDFIEKNILYSKTMELFGRENEIQQLSKELEITLNSNPNFISITGDAGIGKTFLVENFLSREKEKDDNIQICQSICYQYEQNTPFFCWRAIIRQLMQLPDDLSDSIAELLVTSFFMEHFPEEENWVPSFLNILGYNIKESQNILDMEASVKQQNIFIIVTKIIKLFAKNPFVFVLENLQGCDVVSLKLLEYIRINLTDIKVLIIMVARNSEITKQFFQKNNIKNISLSPLSKESSILLAKFLLNMKTDNNSLVEKIVYSSEGNPFFIENIIRSLLESKTLIEDKDGTRYISENVKSIQNIEIPSSIQNIILSRLDSLKLEEQIVCKTASAIGRTFYSDCLRNILPEGISDLMLENALKDFETHNIISKNEDKSKEYVFNHVIMHDVIYETILDTTKKELNLMILAYLERKNQDNTYSIIEKLEYHAMEARDYEKIFLYASKAGEKAEAQASPTDAITHFTIAEDAWLKIETKKNTVSLFSLQLRLAEQFRIIGKYTEAETIFNKIIKECKEKTIYANALRGLGRCFQERGDFDSSVKTLELALKTLGKKAPKSMLAVYLTIVKEAIIQIFSYGLLKGKVKQYKNEKLEKIKIETDILCVLNKLYYFGLPEKIAWSSLANFNISLHTSASNKYNDITEPERLCLACGDYAVSLSSAGLKKLCINIFDKGSNLSQITDNQKVSHIFKARHAFFFLFYNQPDRSIELLEEACNYFRKISEQWELMTAEGALGQNYFLIGEFDKSLVAYEETEKLSIILHSSMHLGWAYNKVPFIKYITGKISAQEAISQLHEGIKQSSSVHDNMTLCIHYGHLAFIETKEKNFKEALKQAEKIMKENNLYKINIPHIKISYVNVVEAIYYASINGEIPKNKESSYIKMAEKALKAVTKISKNHEMLLGPAQRAKAMFALLCKNNDVAKVYYQNAIDFLQNSPYKWEYKNTIKFGQENNF